MDFIARLKPRIVLLPSVYTTIKRLGRMVGDKLAEPIGQDGQAGLIDPLAYHKYFFGQQKSRERVPAFLYLLLTFVGCVDDFFQF